MISTGDFFVVVAFLFASKTAFDTADHHILLIQTFGITGKALDRFQS